MLCKIFKKIQEKPNTEGISSDKKHSWRNILQLQILEKQNCEDLNLINRLQKFGEISVRARTKSKISLGCLICGPQATLHYNWALLINHWELNTSRNYCLFVHRAIYKYSLKLYCCKEETICRPVVFSEPKLV